MTAAERHAHAALKIREPLGLKEAVVDFDLLAEVAAVRGDTAVSAEWARKRDELQVNLLRRAGGNAVLGSLAPSSNLQRAK